MNDVRQHFLDGLPIRPVHVSAGCLNLLGVGQATQEFDNGHLTPVVQHIHQAAVTNVGDDAPWRGEVDFVQPNDGRGFALEILLQFLHVLSEDGADGLLVHANLSGNFGERVATA